MKGRWRALSTGQRSLYLVQGSVERLLGVGKEI